MKKFVCTVCGYIHEGESAPESCPVCKVPAERFNEVKGEMKLAAEHEYGIYEKTVANNPDISAEDKAYILRSVCTGRRPLGRRLSTLLSSLSCWARFWSPI